MQSMTLPDPFYYVDSDRTKIFRGLQKNTRKVREDISVKMGTRLGLLFQDLADRFSTSLSSSSKIFQWLSSSNEIFQCWILAMSKSLSSFVFKPDEEKVRLTLPKRFDKYSSDIGNYWLLRNFHWNSKWPGATVCYLFWV